MDKVKGNEYDDDGELLLGMKEINQRRKELKMTEDEWVVTWMLGIVKKRKKLDKFIIHILSSFRGSETWGRQFNSKH